MLPFQKVLITINILIIYVCEILKSIFFLPSINIDMTYGIYYQSSFQGDNFTPQISNYSCVPSTIISEKLAKFYIIVYIKIYISVFNFGDIKK